MQLRTLLGKAGEERVAQYLEKHGFSILEKNYAQRTGEIDLIACKGELLVFVEVKMRTETSFDLCEVITYSKQKKIISVAKNYLARHDQDHTTKSCRFDVALIDNATNRLTYLPDAFRDQ